MRNSPGKHGKHERQSEKVPERTKLSKIIDDNTQNEPVGVLYAIFETMEDVNAYVLDTNTSHPESDEDDDFEASQVPEGFGVEEVGPLMTNEEVSKAIQRNGSSQIASDAVAEQSDQSRKQTLRSRKAKTGQPRDEQNPGEDAGEGIFGTSVKHSKFTLNNYLQSVASTREKRIVAVTAWLLTFIGLIVALVFVTKDFLDSRNEMASTVRYEDSESLNLPPLSICSAETEMPHFMDLPNATYLGKPLVWLDYIRGTHAEINITYPDTRDLRQVSFGSFDVMGAPCNATKVMDPLLFFRENTAKPSCFYCLTLTQNPPLTIRKEGETKDGITFSRLLSLRISQNSFGSRCRYSQFGLSGIMLRFFREELRSQHMALSERGILDFGEYDPSNRSDDGILWPNYRMGFRNTTVDFVVYDIVDMFCNVYLFSGLFYPSTASDIQYKFDNRLFRWERSGTGPYYPADYFEYYTRSEQVVLYSGTGKIGQEKYENQSMYDSSTLQIRTNHSRIGGTETIAVLQPSEITSVELSRNVMKEKESFESHSLSTDLLAGDVRTVNNVYLVDIGFKNFLTRVVSDQQSVSWSAFAADFFGLTSLFMDVSVYTLIVSPLIMRGRRRALAARKRRLVQTSVEV